MKKRLTGYQKACRKIDIEGRKQCFLIYSASGILLWRHYGKRKQAIERLFKVSREVWRDCATDHDHSMIEMCENETGIEIQNEDGKSWRDVIYLNGSINPGMMSEAQWIYMRQQQARWVRHQIMACMMVSLHRKYGFGFERCGRFYQQIQEIEAEFNNNPDRIREACFKLTGIDVADTVTGEGD